MSSTCESVQIPEQSNKTGYGFLAMNLDKIDVEYETGPKITDFLFLKLLGTGGFGKVFQVRKLKGKYEGRIFAMKSIEKSLVVKKKKEIEHTLSERNVLAQLKSPFIVEMLYAFQTEKKLYFVMEYLQGGELFTRMEFAKTFTEPVARFYLSEVVIAINYLHTNNIVHRDLKPDNIVLDHLGHIKLTDFGLCKGNMMDNDKTHTFCGTVEYMAPEIILRKGHGKAVDLWSLGIMMYDMLHGNVPFSTEEKIETMELITKGKFKLLKTITEEGKDLLKRLLSLEVEKRITCREIREHEFFADINWEKMEAREIQPPFLPKFVSKDDVSHFSKNFTNMPVVGESIETDEEDLDPEDVFADFDYVSPSF